MTSPAPGRTGRRRCYGCDEAEARYEAHLDHDTTPVVLLCEACAIWERNAGSVVWIHTLGTKRHPAKPEDSQPGIAGQQGSLKCGTLSRVPGWAIPLTGR
jgi:hypothetical protein